MRKSLTQRVFLADELSGFVTTHTAFTPTPQSSLNSPTTAESEFSSLCRFSASLTRPTWEVKFPLVLSSPQLRGNGKKSLHFLEERRSDRVGSRPRTHPKPRVHNAPPVTLQSALVMEHLTSQCQAFLTATRRNIQKSKKELKDMKSGLKTTAKHVRLIALSNKKAAYYVLRHKFHRVKLEN